MSQQGRPSKSSDRRKVGRIEIRVTPPEQAAFREAAELAGIGLSTWVRERLRLAAIRELEAAGRRAAFIASVPLEGGSDV